MSGPAGAAPGLPLEELERVVEGACGLALSPGVRRTLLEGFLRAARDAGSAPEPFLRRVLAGEARSVAALVEQAVVGETYFFRHPEQLAALSGLLDEAAPGGRPLTIWSAGCASGEEPYGLAMLLLEAGRGGVADRILATDVSARALEAARAARYGGWSLRRTDAALRSRWFREAGPRLTVAPQVRERVSFSRHNLVLEPPPGAGFDVVVCRNVLIYFSPATAAQVLARLVEAVRPGGYLLLGPVEEPLAAGLPLLRVERPGATLLRRPPYAVSDASRRLLESLRGRRTEPARPPPDPAAPGCGPDGAAAFLAAREAARAGDLAGAERLAGEAATRHRCPESFLLLAVAAEVRGDDAAAQEAVRRALELAPGLAQGHATLVRLHARQGRPGEAALARRAALDALEGLPDETTLRGVEPLTAGALRQALGAPPAPAATPSPGSTR